MVTRTQSFLVLLVIASLNSLPSMSQVVQFTHDSSIVNIPKEIQIESMGSIDDTTLVVWGATVKGTSTLQKNVLVMQRVIGTEKVDSAEVLSDSESSPHSVVKVVP